MGLRRRSQSCRRVCIPRPAFTAIFTAALVHLSHSIAAYNHLKTNISDANNGARSCLIQATKPFHEDLWIPDYELHRKRRWSKISHCCTEVLNELMVTNRNNRKTKVVWISGCQFEQTLDGFSFTQGDHKPNLDQSAVSKLTYLWRNKFTSLSLSKRDATRFQRQTISLHTRCDYKTL